MGHNLRERTRAAVAARTDAPPPAPPAETDRDEQLQLAMTNVIVGLHDQIARALPRHMDADRMVRVAVTAVRLNPKLARCSVRSISGAVLTAAVLGLEPSVNGQCWLMPEMQIDEASQQPWWECQLWIGYQGYVKQVLQSGLVSSIDAQAVREHDVFKHQKGTTPYLVHQKARGDRGPIIAYYAIAQLPTGNDAPFEVLWPEEVRELRGGKEGPNPGHTDPQSWMERKVVVRQLAKLLPKSPELAATLDADERNGAELYAQRLAEREAADVIADATPNPEPNPPAPEPPATANAAAQSADLGKAHRQRTSRRARKARHRKRG
ncbi:recombinase RecT [Nocardia sp. NPDC004711]